MKQSRDMVPLTLRLDDDSRERLVTVAIVQDRTQNDVMREAVTRGLDRILGNPDFQERFVAYEARVRALVGLVQVDEVSPTATP